MVDDNAKLYRGIRESLEQRMIELFTLYDVSQVVSSSLDLGTILNRVVDLAAATLKADEACVTLAENGKHRIYLNRGLEEDVERSCMAILRSMRTSSLLSGGVPLLVKTSPKTWNFHDF